ncbi:hypothetical protein BH10BAC1_BH10BAC1_07690 [soil metagenome]
MSSYTTIIFTPIRKLLRNHFWEKILYALAKKHSLNSLISKIAPGNNLYKKGTIRKAKREGIHYILDISDYQHWLIYFGVNEDRPSGLFELVKTGDLIIDIGANIGQTAMTFAKLGGENSMIYGFEPDPVNFLIAKENLKQNKFKNIHYFNVGLGSKKEELSLKINSPQNRGGNRIDRNRSEESFTIKIESLDDLIAQLNIENVNLIKIDVEGFEKEVLEGAIKTIKKFSPTLFIEIDDRNLQEQETSARELVDYISSLGYICVNATNKKTIKSSIDLKNCHFDVICNSNNLLIS